MPKPKILKTEASKSINIYAGSFSKIIKNNQNINEISKANSELNYQNIFSALYMLEKNLNDISLHIYALQDQKKVASDIKNISIEIEAGIKHFSEQDILDEKIAFLDTIRINITKFINDIDTHTKSSELSALPPSIAFDLESITILNHHRHAPFINFVGDVARCAHAALSVLWMILCSPITLGLIIAKQCSFISNKKYDSGIALTTLLFPDYYSYRNDTYGQFFSTGHPTSSFALANLAVNNYNDLQKNFSSLDQLIAGNWDDIAEDIQQYETTKTPQL